MQFQGDIVLQRSHTRPLLLRGIAGGRGPIGGELVQRHLDGASVGAGKVYDRKSERHIGDRRAAGTEPAISKRSSARRSLPFAFAPPESSHPRHWRRRSPSRWRRRRPVRSRPATAPGRPSRRRSRPRRMPTAKPEYARFTVALRGAKIEPPLAMQQIPGPDRSAGHARFIQSAGRSTPAALRRPPPDLDGHDGEIEARFAPVSPRGSLSTL